LCRCWWGGRRCGWVRGRPDRMNRGAGRRRRGWSLCRWWSCLYASCWPHVPDERTPVATTLTAPMHSHASSQPPIPPGRVPAPRCTITRSPLQPPSVTLAPEPRIRGASLHAPQDRPNSTRARPIPTSRLSEDRRSGLEFDRIGLWSRRGDLIGKLGGRAR